MCGRRLEAHWVHGRAGYRCRHGHSSARRQGERLRAIYWPQQRILTESLHQLVAVGVLTPSTGATELVAHLRAADAVIICAAGQLRIAAHNGETGSSQAAAPRIPAQRKDAENPHHIHPRKE
ncbi:hypothetical protein ACGFJ7_46680 [Actinoplanes sp. NPDC048988]|uniref:hypothetical protein n=1 Tax=Actinoplanes sp. NPDC048988 TaxID=3363901 RepID=UPI00371F5538